MEKGLLASPTFYLSAYLEARREAYYDRLLAVSRDGDWTGWCVFFLKAVERQAKANSGTARDILALYQEKKDWIVELTHSQHAIHALDWLFARPIFKSTDFINSSGIPAPSARRILNEAHEGGLLRRVRESRGRRAAVYALTEVLRIAAAREHPDDHT
jgi:Fic family protein